jgi:hypothetical protein
MQPLLPPPTVERRAIQTFVDSILMEAGQYKGFAYLTADKAAPGKSFGVEFPEDGGFPFFRDHTRIGVLLGAKPL